MKQNNLLLAVNGTLMRGLELENNLKEVGAFFIKESKTEKAYRLFSINDKYPAMIRVDNGGNTVDVELYAISEEGIKQVLAKEPPGLTIKEITLIDGVSVLGVVGEDDIIKGQKEITSYGGWRNYIAKRENNMKKLFIYYSYTGRGDIVAQKMQEKGYDIRKVETVKSLPKSFFWGMMVGGFQAGAKKKAELKDFDKDISMYEEVVFGSPIWNGTFTPALNSLLSVLDLSNKKLSFIFYSGSGEGKKAVKRLNKEYPNAPYIFLKDPKKYPEELKKLD